MWGGFWKASILDSSLRFAAFGMTGVGVGVSPPLRDDVVGAAFEEGDDVGDGAFV